MVVQVKPGESITVENLVSILTLLKQWPVNLATPKVACKFCTKVNQLGGSKRLTKADTAIIGNPTSRQINH
ncbi:hypothetical protein NIES4073_15230 [Kalymmatonema gypsitolerans NIES-4073]|nr:hypothetical protein NIES4073_15230 [Scytonema sp. NIES-4073]